MKIDVRSQIVRGLLTNIFTRILERDAEEINKLLDSEDDELITVELNKVFDNATDEQKKQIQIEVSNIYNIKY